MGLPHPALLDLASGRVLSPVEGYEDLLRSATEHRMKGLLWTRVSSGEVVWSRNQNLRLAADFLATEERNRRMWRAIPAIIERLEAIGVEAAVLKGVPAEARWYNRIGERPCSDLDLLISPGGRCRAGEIIRALDPQHELRDVFQSILDRGLSREVVLVVEGIRIDLHFDLLGFGLPWQAPHLLWKHTAQYDFPLARVRVLDAELSLIHFLINLNCDSFFRLLGFVDVSRLISKEDLDWDKIGFLTELQGLEVPVWKSLEAVACTLEVDWRGQIPRGPRAGIWRILWRPTVRLQGQVGWHRFRHRNYWLPFLTRGRSAEAFAWLWRQCILSPALISNGKVGQWGPWPLQLISDRVSRLRSRRRAVRRWKL